MTMLKRFLLIAALLLVGTGAGYGQTVEQLRREIDQANREIEKANKILSSNKKEQKDQLYVLSITRNKIRNRQSIIESLNKQSRVIEGNIRTNGTEIERLNGELAKIKKEYARVLVSGYKDYLFNNALLFLLSSADFHQFQMRLYYIRRFGQMRMKLARELETTSTQISEETDKLKEKQRELAAVAEERRAEVQKLDDERGKYAAALASLKKEGTKIDKQIQEKRRQINNLQKKISQIVAEENRKRKGTTLSAKEKEIDIKLSADFAQNQGKLPRPVESGAIIEGFGIHAHPIHQSLKVENNGVNFAAESGSPIKAIFNGVVSKVAFFPGLNNCVFIRHGAYISVYSGLTELNVKVNDKVSTGEVIGKITSNNGGTCELHFELWKENTKLNPELWIRR